jgi:DNA-binding NarL/FixJ family response regulator
MSPDTVELLSVALESAEAFLRQHQPTVIVYDIAPPDERNWRFFEHLRETVLKGYVFVLTSTHAAQVERLIGRAAHMYEVIGKRFDLNAIVDAVREAARARPTE